MTSPQSSHYFARQLHFSEGISLLDKVDLYYALDIKPGPSIRQRLIQNFEVHFDDSGLIAGSDLLHHWDLVHPNSEPEYDEDGFTVPMEFRSTILEETSATLDEEGFIADFPDCPDQIVLQSHPYNTVIGISSTSRQKIKEKMSGWAFWKQFQKDCPTKRTWKSLSEHFMEDLGGTIMELHYDLKTKIELYFALSVPVEEETLREFKTIAVVVLAKGYIIKYAAGHKFSIGRKDNVVSDEKELEDHNEEEKCKLSFLAMMGCERKREEEEEMKALEHLPNLHKMPFDLITKAVLYYKSVFIFLFWNVFSFKFI